MLVNSIILKTGKVNDYLHIVDLHQYGLERIASIFIAEFDDYIMIFDCGTSLNTKRLLRYFKRNNLNLASVKYIVVSHYHFDHMGGAWKLFNEIEKFNPNVRILSCQLTRERYNNFKNEPSYIHSRKTFGGLLGEIKEIKESAFKVIEPIDEFEKINEVFNFVDTFTLKDKEIKFTLIKTPGHTSDHISPLLIKDGKIDFIYVGEALGLMNQSKELITGPSSGAPDFNYKDHMNTLKNFKKIKPLSIGFSHFGMVLGKQNIQKLIYDHELYMKEFRKRVIKYYEEKPETKYVFDKIYDFLIARAEARNGYTDNPIVVKLILSVVYGMMMDLGYRKDF
ncbi:MAG: MBL fold metallo-hydrolase [Candidatus Hermodarchaeota archaeon]